MGPFNIVREVHLVSSHMHHIIAKDMGIFVPIWLFKQRCPSSCLPVPVAGSVAIVLMCC